MYTGGLKTHSNKYHLYSLWFYNRIDKQSLLIIMLSITNLIIFVVQQRIKRVNINESCYSLNAYLRAALPHLLAKSDFKRIKQVEQCKSM